MFWIGVLVGFVVGLIVGVAVICLALRGIGPNF